MGAQAFYETLSQVLEDALGVGPRGAPKALLALTIGLLPGP